MDRVIEKKRWSMKRIPPIAGVLGLIASACLNNTGKPKLNVAQDRLMISEDSKRNFQEFILINGLVLPIQTMYLDAIEGGRVEELNAEDGVMLKKGQTMIKNDK